MRNTKSFWMFCRQIKYVSMLLCIAVLLIFSNSAMTKNIASTEVERVLIESVSIDKARFRLMEGTILNVRNRAEYSVGMNIYCAPVMILPKTECLILLVEYERDNDGRILIVKTRDGLKVKIPLGKRLFTSGDVFCKVNKRTEDHAVVLGHWRWINRKAGSGVVDGILKAWVVDVDSMNFIEVPPNSAACIVNEDRN
jgi:hypothetical protein